MRLFELLEVDPHRLPRHTLPAVHYCERAWQERCKPTEARYLVDFLDEALRSCTEAGLRYPRVLLLRLKQLQRGEWTSVASRHETGF